MAEELGETVELRTDNGSGEARVEAGIATAATTFVNKSAEKGQMGEKRTTTNSAPGKDVSMMRPKKRIIKGPGYGHHRACRVRIGRLE